jgi:hypothetical protein
LKVDVVLGDLAEGAIENRHLVLDTKPQVRVLVEGPLAGGVDVGRLQGNRLVAVLLGELDPEVLVLVFHVGAPEDDQSGLPAMSII